VKGFVPYDQVAELLAAAVEAVDGGHLWMAEDVLEKFTEAASQLYRTTRERGGQLTKSERTVIGHLQAGLSNKEIASRLGTSERTVKFHVGNVLRKLDVKSRYSLMARLGVGNARGELTTFE
jgi:DNA-binding NarL/FixJ family response regulator